MVELIGGHLLDAATGHGHGRVGGNVGGAHHGHQHAGDVLADAAALLEDHAAGVENETLARTHGLAAVADVLSHPVHQSLGLVRVRSPGHPGRLQHLGHLGVDLRGGVELGVVDVEKPSFLQGVSLLPALKGKKLPKRPIYFESMYPYYSRGWAPLRGFIYSKEKYIDSPLPELYDLGEDFDELKNLAERKKQDEYRRQLEVIIKNQSLPENVGAKRQFDRESLEKLRSLGYASAYQVTKKESFGPEDDVKVLLPYHNKAMKALELVEEGRGREGFKLLKEIITETEYLHIRVTFPPRLTQDTAIVLDMASHSPIGEATAYLSKMIPDAQIVDVSNTYGGNLKEKDWAGVVQELYSVFNRILSRSEASRLHLFHAMPVAMAFGLGMALGNFVPVTVYNLERLDEVYYPVIKLNELESFL